MGTSNSHCIACGATNPIQAKFCLNCGQPLPAATQVLPTSTLTGLLPLNHLLSQRYCIISQIGKGGMGAVYKAEDRHFSNHRLVAIKEMSQGGLSNVEYIKASESFKQEAHMLEGLKHHNLPLVFDYFEDSGRWYFVMDFIEGETLEDYIHKKGGKLPVMEVLDIGIQLCTVLEYLHTRQPSIIFRDLKPANIMRTADGHLYLIDFGIARHFKPGQAKDTTAFGSPGYAAPEQYGKTQTTPRSDIFSLGAILHQLITGIDPTQKPFYFAPLKSSNQIFPTELEPLLMKMVEMNENNRPDTIATVKQELQRIAAQYTPSSLTPLSPASPQQLQTPVPPKLPFGGHMISRRTQNLLWGMVVLVLMVSLFGVWLSHSSSTNLSGAQNPNLLDTSKQTSTASQTSQPTSTPLPTDTPTPMLNTSQPTPAPSPTDTPVLNASQPTPTPLPTDTPTPVPNTSQINVQANSDWQDSGIFIPDGAVVNIRYVSGYWRPWPGANFDGKGCTQGCDPVTNNVLVGCDHGGLIGRIGSGQMICILNGTTVTATESGQLYLRINDQVVSDDSGAITIQITLE